MVGLAIPQSGRGCCTGSTRAPSAGRGHHAHARRERELAQRYIERLAIKTRDGDTPIGALSGGNQQKVVLARWLAERIDVFLMDEPTRGIDVGARAEIYNLFYELAEAGRVLHGLGEEVRRVLVRGDERHLELERLDHVAHEEVSSLDVLHAVNEHRSH
jgi:ABC-type sugar transport system ATPase subunit